MDRRDACALLLDGPDVTLPEWALEAWGADRAQRVRDAVHSRIAAAVWGTLEAKAPWDLLLLFDGDLSGEEMCVIAHGLVTRKPSFQIADALADGGGPSLPTGSIPAGFGSAPPIQVIPQDGGDQAHNWRQVVLHAFEDGYERVALVPGWVGDVTSDDVANVFACLDAGARVVLVPGAGGEVALVGLDGVHLELFREVPWGTGMETETLADRARGWHLPCETLAPVPTLLTPASLESTA